jgi:pyruvate formate lyase activating enzyme
MLKEALFYEKANRRTDCKLCPHLCHIPPGASGVCRVRKNVEGVLYASNYADCASLALDPIEKKPLYHFYPGSTILSVGARGCNLKCAFCQNWELAHGDFVGRSVEPESLVNLALECQSRGCIGIAFTYSEPLMWYEFVYETAKLAHEAQLKSVLVTNGFINELPLLQMLPYIDALNIDLKSYTQEFYMKYCKGSLEHVLRTIRLASEVCHVELTTLLIPGLNDSPHEINSLVDWIASVDTRIPLHFSRYFPNYQMELPPTPLDTLRLAQEIALKRLDFVYLGNVRDVHASTTYCPNCGLTAITRDGQYPEIGGAVDGRCRDCGVSLNLVL